MILKFERLFRNGFLHISENGCALVLQVPQNMCMTLGQKFNSTQNTLNLISCHQRDLEYWAIDELIMEPCCALKYFPKIEVSLHWSPKQRRLMEGQLNRFFQNQGIAKRGQGQGQGSEPCQDLLVEMPYRAKQILSVPGL